MKTGQGRGNPGREREEEEEEGSITSGQSDHSPSHPHLAISTFHLGEPTQHTRHLFLSLPLKCIDWANETPLLQVWLPCSSDLLVQAQGSPISQVLVWTYVGSVPALPPRTSLLEKRGV